MNETQIIITGIATIIGAITTLLVRGRVLQKSKDEALTLPEKQRYSFLLSKGEKLPINKVEKLSDKAYKDLVNKIYDQKERGQKRYFYFAYFIVIIAAIIILSQFFFLNRTSNFNSFDEKIVKFEEESDSVKIAIFPFKHYDGKNSDDLADALYEAFIKENRFGLAKIKIKKLDYLPLSMSDNERIRISNNINADVVLWGSLEELENHQKRSAIRYLFQTTDKESFIVEEENEFKSFIKDVEKGELTTNLTYSIYLFQGLKYLLKDLNFRKANFCSERMIELSRGNEDLKKDAGFFSILCMMMNMMFEQGDENIPIIPEENKIDVMELFEMDRLKEKYNKESILD